MNIKKKSGFTLVELMVVVAIMAFVLPGMIKLFIYTSVSAELSANKTLAITEAHDKIEEIRNQDFDSIAGAYDGATFTLANLNGRGIIDIDSSNSELLEIDIVVSYENKFNRVVGEDKNLDGVLDAGEIDADSNGVPDSPVRLMTFITRR